MSVPGKWKENALRKFSPKDNVLATPEEWRTWVLPTSDKFDIMGYTFFMKVADALILEDEEFHQIVAHPIQDSFTTPAFKVAVINLVVNNSTDFFPDPNDNVNPAVGVKGTIFTSRKCFLASKLSSLMRALRPWRRSFRRRHASRIR